MRYVQSGTLSWFCCDSCFFEYISAFTVSELWSKASQNRNQSLESGCHWDIFICFFQLPDCRMVETFAITPTTHLLTVAAVICSQWRVWIRDHGWWSAHLPRCAPAGVCSSMCNLLHAQLDSLHLLRGQWNLRIAGVQMQFTLTHFFTRFISLQLTPTHVLTRWVVPQIWLRPCFSPMKSLWSRWAPAFIFIGWP